MRVTLFFLIILILYLITNFRDTIIYNNLSICYSVITFLKRIKGFLNVVPPSGSTTFKEAFLWGGNTQRTKGTNKDIKNIFLAFGGLIFLKSVMIKTSKI